ncbi:MAG: DUF2513 domain-containing protein [Beijerinckiaceae bacterium]|nr:DUF2513 domain-containing protein [Beijerinckiaceae bacterium]
MRQDVDLLRVILISLEAAERSPPEPIFVGLRELAASFATSPLDILNHLEYLAQSELIEGPGVYLEEEFLFRKLTRKGRVLVDAIRDLDDWTKVKSSYLPDAK